MTNDEQTNAILSWFDALNQGDLALLDQKADVLFTDGFAFDCLASVRCASGGIYRCGGRPAWTRDERGQFMDPKKIFAPFLRGGGAAAGMEQGYSPNFSNSPENFMPLAAMISVSCDTIQG